MEKAELVLCDTDVLIELLDRNNADVSKRIQAIGVGNIAVSAVSAGELIRGVRDKQHLIRISSFLARTIIVPLTAKISDQHLMLMHEYTLSHRIQVYDALIAATALLLDLPFYTHNVKHFRYIKGLRLI